MTPSGAPKDQLAAAHREAEAQADRLLDDKDKQVDVGCVMGVYLAMLVLILSCAGLIGPSTALGSGSNRTAQAITAPPEQDTDLGRLPRLPGVKPATATTSTPPTTEPPVAATEPAPSAAPAAGGQASPGPGSGSSGQAPAPPAPPEPPAEICATTGSISISGGSPGGLGGAGGTYTASGPSRISFSGYPTCHSYIAQISSSDGASGRACFQTAVALNIGTTPDAVVTVTVQASPGTQC